MKFDVIYKNISINYNVGIHRYLYEKYYSVKGYVLATENAAGNKIGKGPLLF